LKPTSQFSLHLLLSLTGSLDNVVPELALLATMGYEPLYTLCINGRQFKSLLHAFKLAKLTSFESRNSFELSTQKRG